MSLVTLKRRQVLVTLLRHHGASDLTYQFEDLGQDTNIAAQGLQSTYIYRLTWWANKLFLGHGRTDETPRPLSTRYWDSADATYKSLGTDVDIDAYYTHWIYDGRLFLLATDPAGTVADQDYNEINAAGTTATIHDADPPLTEHCWHGATHSDGNLYLAGSVSATSRGTVWRTPDRGTTWATAYTAATANYHWYVFIFHLLGYLWVQAYKATATTGMQGNAFRSTDGVTWSDSGIKVLPTGLTNVSGGRTVVFNNKAFILSGKQEYFDKRLYMFNGTDAGSEIGNAIWGDIVVEDICSDGDALYALVAHRYVWKTVDGSAWTYVTDSGVGGGLSIEVVDGTIYIGNWLSHVYKGTPTGFVDSNTYVINTGGAKLVNLEGDFVTT